MRVKYKGTLPPRNLKSTEQILSNFINCKGGYFNKGKHKGKMITNVPIKYLLWVYENIMNLNQSEIRVLSSSIEKKHSKIGFAHFFLPF